MEKYIKDNGYKKSIAQLFVVGIPVDYKNVSGSSDLNKLITDMNVGGVMLNSYNLPSVELKKGDNRKLAFNNAIHLMHNITMKSSSSVKTPVFIYADFEGYGYSSINYPLTPPPNPLVLSSSGDIKNSYYAGLVSGYQLKALGVDVILGPVLDLDHGLQGSPNLSISLRSFSESKKIMLPYAKAYLDGLSDSHILAFAKHFPSYGHVYENAHKEQPVYNGSLEKIKSEIQSFEDIKDSYSGIMTSHLVVKTNDKNIPVTYNKNFISDNLLDKKSLSSKILITDDLSNMEASKIYIEKRYEKFSYVKSAENAFKAGHDLLLFSHLSGSGTKKHSSLTIKDIENSILAIEKIIEENPVYRKRFKESLGKILKLKQERNYKRLYPIDFEMKDLFNGEFTSLNDYLKKTYSQAIIKISNGKQGSALEYIDENNKLLIGTKSILDIYMRELDGELSMSTYVLPSMYNTSADFKVEKSRIINAIEKSGLVFMAVENIDHINLLDNIRLRNPSLLDKIIVFLHTTPHMLNIDILNSVAIYGNFSKDPLSYEVDVDIIRGDLKAKSISYLPLSIGNGSIHDSRDTIKPVNSLPENKPLIIFDSNAEREYYDKIIFLEKDLESKKREISKYEAVRSNVYTAFSPLILAILCIVGAIFIKKDIIKSEFKKTSVISLYCSFLIFIVVTYYANVYPEFPILKHISYFISKILPYNEVLPEN
ncbi:glycoside hydrolase family 3 N-terminal domain-containing protein [Shewanella baltica]|uniref:glycoside hydrolase family 3 N-terminal domain-containing protein n=1 Tax=Shewanella baltica TaxID=62322 RepID=UPI0030D2855A